MGPVMNYVGEIETGEIKLRIAMFEKDGESNFTVPVNDEKVPVEYSSSNGRHTVKIGQSGVVFKVEALGPDSDAVEVIRI